MRIGRGRLSGKKRNNKKNVGSLRRTQLITTFGPGSIIDFPNHSIMISGIDYWDYKNKENDYSINEENLQRQLGVDYFLQPKVEEKNFTDYGDGSHDILGITFPEIFICKNCNKIDKYKNFKRNNKLICACGASKESIIPSRFVVSCEKGHVDDFPYSWWAHRSNPNIKCEDKYNLAMEIKDESDGLEGIIIKCKSCGSENSMSGIFGRDALKGIVCRGNRPWLKDMEECNQIVKTLQRGATNVYYGVHESALSIPPWSKRINQIISKPENWKFLKKCVDDEVVVRRMIEQAGIQAECKCSIDDIIKHIHWKISNEEKMPIITREEIRQDEYKSLYKGISEEDDIHFQIEETDIDKILRQYIDKLVLVKRLREVQALTGFYRISPADEDNEKEVSPIYKEKQDWLPAIELKGEGIFIVLNEEKVKEWEERLDVKSRYNIIYKNMEKSLFKKKNMSPRYVLLHTISHLLMKQLTLDSGYSATSIKERIYSTYTNDQIDSPIDMAGILIYTATPDSEGSLGGVVDSGNIERFKNSVLKALEDASWCSSDPLCIQSKGQGIDNLNLAACHSCLLLPETSCELRNCYLDRASVIGTLENKDMAFFRDIIV